MIYVIIQFSCIIYLVFNAKINNLNIFTITLILLSALIGISAVISMKPKNINIKPQLKNTHKLVTNGIYKFIRHPMYVSVLLFCLALMLSSSNLISQLVMLILFINLILKSNLEERLLIERFTDYQFYKKNTGRFLPFL